MPKLKIVGAGTPTPTRDRWGTCFILEICDQAADDRLRPRIDL